MITIGMIIGITAFLWFLMNWLNTPHRLTMMIKANIPVRMKQ